MKKGIFIILLAIIICQSCLGKENSRQSEANKQNTVEQLFRNFSKENNATRVKIGGFAVSLVGIFADTKGVSGVEVYSLEECDNSVKDSFNAAIKNLKDNSYETLISTSEGGERTKILVKINNDYINEIVVIAGGNSPALVRIKGKIRTDDVQSVIENNK